MLELYHFWDSPCCFKVRTVLAEFELVWTERYVMTVHFEHLQPDYQKLNPHCRVPTLVHDGLVVIQSSVIAEYLNDQTWKRQVDAEFASRIGCNAGVDGR